MRSLASAEYQEADIAKTKLFFLLEPFEKIDQESLLNKLSNIDQDNKLYSQYKNYSRTIASEMDHELSSEELKTVKTVVYMDNFINI